MNLKMNQDEKLWKKILWAVDPFVANKKLLVSALKAIHLLTKTENIPVEPIYILNQSPLGIPILLPSEIISKTQEVGQEELIKANYHVRLNNLLLFKIISATFLTQKESSEALISYAKSSNFDLIVAGTHAQTGLRRWFVGSFVENLMLYSDVPIFVVNPYWNTDSEMKNVLFPTDFSKESLSVFDQVLDLAKKLGGHLTIFHQVLYSVTPEIEETFSAYPLYKDAFDEEMRSKQAEAVRLAALAQQRGVMAHVYLDSKVRGSIAEAILKFSTAKHCVIAMAARSGKLSTVLLGSTTRKVVRGASYPVWVIHPHLTADEQQKQNVA